MFTETFQVKGSSLALMRPGERGTVTQFRSTDVNLVERIRSMGIIPGLSITLEQNVPSVILKAGETTMTLDKAIARSIYVRLH